ncbi:CYFA0S21e01288g1_1 [Cyberlindnera fabianii]|uniref:ATP-dependent DNA helicase PIF1 n=1 Tax=Cyberlindnera fabianii TaxID=36022 RepID=A0A061BDU2_CYBFA|nr:CYFA0S21e01288g1_1 [Cyberlindnera fabianii]
MSGKSRTISKKKLPFKAPSPLLKRNNQKPLPFFSRSKSNVEEKKKPLEFKTQSEINRSSSEVDTLLSLSRSKSSLSQLTSTTSFDEVEQIDLTMEEQHEPQIKNYKNSQPAGSLIRESTRNTTITTVHSQSFTPNVKLNSLKTSGGSGQSQLSFGGKPIGSQTKRKNPWDSSSLSKVKNPRLKEKTRNVPNYMDSSLDTITLSDEQRAILKLVVEGGKSVFYTGSAGTGKSVLMKEIVRRLRSKYGQRAVAVTASTGLAAVNIGGQTINRFSGMGIGDKHPKQHVATIKRNPERRENWKRTKALIVDEISMLDGNFLDKLDQVARGVREVDLPFGGIQVVLTGDFFQLPPVPNKQGPPVTFCFDCNAWRFIQHKVLLHKVFRQADSEFVDILNCVRIADVNDEVSKQLIELSREVVYEDGIQPTELYPTRYEVENSNKRRLAQLTGKEMIFEANDFARNDQEKRLLENTMAVSKLILKEDAQVMMLKNKDETLVNGSVGKVLAFLSPGIYIEYRSAFQLSLGTEQSVKEMRLISKCHRLTELTSEILKELQEIPNDRQEEVIRIATSAMRDPSTLMPVIKFTTPDGSRIDLIEPEEFIVSEGYSPEESGIKRVQLPLLLSWALSIHKSQGQTLDRVKVDLAKVFEAGQVYVSLSRAVSKDRLQILNYSKGKIRANEQVKRFYEQLQRL